MKKLLFTILALLIGTTAFAASTDIAKPVALFETTLTERITASSTSMTLTSALTKDGSNLASSTYGFVIDEGTANEEFILADCTATACTNLTRGISTLTGTTSVYALIKEHRRGASVKITDAPILLQLYSIISGLQNIVSQMKYSSDLQHATTSNAIVHAKWVDDRFVDKFDNETIAGVKTLTGTIGLNAGATVGSGQSISWSDNNGIISGLATPTSGETTKAANVNYVNNVVASGAATATVSVAGIAKLSTTATDANNPIVVGTNDSRLDNYINVVSTTTSSTFSATGYGTTTLSNIPFGTSTRIEIVSSSTPGADIQIWFNGVYGGTLYNQYINTTQSSNRGNVTLTHSYQNAFIILDINNATSTIKDGRIVFNDREYTGEVASTNSGFFNWASTTASINKVSISNSGNQIGTTTIRAIVIK